MPGVGGYLLNPVWGVCLLLFPLVDAWLYWLFSILNSTPPSALHLPFPAAYLASPLKYPSRTLSSGLVLGTVTSVLAAAFDAGR